MKPVRLKCTSKPYKGETLHLERIKKGLVLVDERDEDVAMIRSADASVRIQLPSFWASRYLVIAGDDGKALSFEPDAKATARIRELIDDCLGQDPAATAATYRRLAIRDLLIGAGSFLLGAIITCASFLTAVFTDVSGGAYVVTSGLLVVGLIEIIRGIYFLVKSSQQGHPHEEEDEEE